MEGMLPAEGFVEEAGVVEVVRARILRTGEAV